MNSQDFWILAVRPYWVVGLESVLRWDTTNIVTYFARVCSRNLVLSDYVSSIIMQKKNKSKKTDSFFSFDLTFFNMYFYYVFEGEVKELRWRIFLVLKRPA